MIDHSAIRSAFRTPLVTALNTVSLAADDVAWENRRFEPTRGETWIRETYLRGIERRTSNGYVQTPGIMQYDVFVPANSGTVSAEDIADTLKEAFQPGTGLSPDIRVDRAEVLPGDPQDVWYIVPVQISFTAYATL